MPVSFPGITLSAVLLSNSTPSKPWSNKSKYSFSASDDRIGMSVRLNGSASPSVSVEGLPSTSVITRSSGLGSVSGTRTTPAATGVTSVSVVGCSPGNCDVGCSIGVASVYSFFATVSVIVGSSSCAVVVVTVTSVDPGSSNTSTLASPALSTSSTVLSPLN
jgi:hypothetical protein